jgi:hypothetical protein
LATTLTLQKLKDEESNLRLRASLSRVVVGTDEDGDDVSTLVVDSVEDDGAPVKGKTTVRPPRQLWLIMDAVTRAIEECGSGFKAFGSPTVRAVSDEIVRERYYARIAERASDDEDGPKVANRQRQAFNRAINAALNAKRRDGAGQRLQSDAVAPDSVTDVTCDALLRGVTFRHGNQELLQLNDG